MYETPMIPIRRRVELEGAFNFRDLGGYDTSSGKTVRVGMLFRSDNLSGLSDGDLETIEGLGIRTVIDLRTPREAEVRGTFPVDRLKVDYVQSSLIDISADHSLAKGDRAHEYIFFRYTQMLIEGARGIKAVFDLLLSPHSLPAVFHCAVGKDRTGLIAALILDSLGVGRDSIVQDYALTSESVAAMISWLEVVAPEIAAQIKELPQVVMSAEAPNMSRVLEWLDQHHGGSSGYLASIGVNLADLDDFRERLLQ